MVCAQHFLLSSKLNFIFNTESGAYPESHYGFMMGSWFMCTVNSAKGLIHSVTSFIIMREVDTLLVDIIILLTYKIAINQKQVDKSFGSYTWFEVFGGLHTGHTNYNSGLSQSQQRITSNYK